MIRILQAHDHRDLAVALGAQDIGELVDAREDMAVARDEIAPDRKEAERLLLRGGAAEADRVLDGGDAASPEVRGRLLDRKSVVSGKSVTERVDLGGHRILKKRTILHSYS